MKETKEVYDGIKAGIALSIIVFLLAIPLFTWLWFGELG
jgi:hypothetical protein